MTNTSIMIRASTTDQYFTGQALPTACTNAYSAVLAGMDATIISGLASIQGRLPFEVVQRTCQPKCAKHSVSTALPSTIECGPRFGGRF